MLLFSIHSWFGAAIIAFGVFQSFIGSVNVSKNKTDDLVFFGE